MMLGDAIEVVIDNGYSIIRNDVWFMLIMALIGIGVVIGIFISKVVMKSKLKL